MSVSVCVFAAVSRPSLLLLHAAMRECFWACYINYPADKMIGQHTSVLFPCNRLRPLDRCGQRGQSVTALCQVVPLASLLQGGHLRHTHVRVRDAGRRAAK